MTEPTEENIRRELKRALSGHEDFLEELGDAFFLNDEKLCRVRDLLDEEISMRLSPKTHHQSPLKFFPSFIEGVPDGTEHGTFLAADIGGTHSRVMVVMIKDGNIKVEMLRDDLVTSCHSWKGAQIFDFIAVELYRLLTQCGLLNTKEPIPLGFTFSFPVKQIALNKAILIQWTKDFHNDDIIGQDVVQLLQDAIERKGNMNIKCCAIINDTIGTLMSGAFKDRECSVGLICGTGTNGCCMEPIDNVVDYKQLTHTNASSVAIDTRWNNFGCDEVIDFIRSEYDEEIRRNTAECAMGIEKLMSGMYIGEVVRQVLLKLHKKKIIVSPWPTQWRDIYSLHTDTVSEILKQETSEDCHQCLESLGMVNLSPCDCNKIRVVCQMVVVRAAYLTASCTSCLVNRVGQSRVGIAVDGSVYKHIHLFREVLVEKIQSLIKAGTQCYFVPCEDGSGVGAALVAAMVTKRRK